MQTNANAEISIIRSSRLVETAFMGMRCFCAQAQKQVTKSEIYLAISSYFSIPLHILLKQIRKTENKVNVG